MEGAKVQFAKIFPEFMINILKQQNLEEQKTNILS